MAVQSLILPVLRFHDLPAVRLARRPPSSPALRELPNAVAVSASVRRRAASVLIFPTRVLPPGIKGTSRRDTRLPLYRQEFREWQLPSRFVGAATPASEDLSTRRALPGLPDLFLRAGLLRREQLDYLELTVADIAKGVKNLLLVLLAHCEFSLHRQS